MSRPNLTVTVTRFIRGRNRDVALQDLVHHLCAHLKLPGEMVFEAVMERERALSSRVADHIAMPHAILETTTDTHVAMGISAAGIAWDSRESLIHVVVLLLGPPQTHLSTMAAFSRLLQVDGMMEAILRSSSAAEIQGLIQRGQPDSEPEAARTLRITSASIHHAAVLGQMLPRNPVVISTAHPGVVQLLGPLHEAGLTRRTYIVGPGLETALGDTARSLEFSGTEGETGESAHQAITIVPTERLSEHADTSAVLTLLPLFTRGILKPGSEVILLSGSGKNGGLDTVRLVDVSRELQIPDGFSDAHLPESVQLDVVARVLYLAAELGAQGREGKPVGTIFVVGDDEHLSRYTQQMILNPFAGHRDTDRNILDPSLSETIKEFAKIDGAFIIRGDGVILSVGTHLAGQPDSAEMEGGLGARHAAALGITAAADVLAVCLSESTGTITLYHKGRRLIRRQGNA